MIPKKIHYVWVGGNKKPDSVINCINSWKKLMPDYEIIEWNESNVDLNLCPYLQDAYKAKKWAFVSDVIRIYVLYTYGGIYLDTDVEVFKSFDGLPECNLSIGYESNLMLETCAIIAEPRNEILGKLLNQYKTEPFIWKEDGYVKTINHRLSELVFNELKIKYLPSGDYMFKEISLYDTEVFTGKPQTARTYSIHHFNGSWKNAVELTFFQSYLFRAKLKIVKIFSKTLGNIRWINLDAKCWDRALFLTYRNKAKHKKIYRKF